MKVILNQLSLVRRRESPVQKDIVGTLMMETVRRLPVNWSHKVKKDQVLFFSYHRPVVFSMVELILEYMNESIYGSYTWLTLFVQLHDSLDNGSWSFEEMPNKSVPSLLSFYFAFNYVIFVILAHIT